MTRRQPRARAATKALEAMRKMQAQGWHGEALLTDAGAAALKALGHDADLAADISRGVWRDHFETFDPN